MNRFLPFSLAVLLGACGSRLFPSSDPPPRPSTPQQTLELLNRVTGTTWRARFDAEQGTASILIGRSAPIAPAGSLTKGVTDFLNRYAALFGLRGEDDELRHTKTDRDPLGMWHMRFTQSYKRVPLWNSGITVHLNPDASITSVEGRMVSLSNLAHVADELPQYDADEARQLALQHVAAQVPESALSTLAPKLLYRYIDRTLQLMYLVEVEGQGREAPLHRAVLLDAHRRDNVLGEHDLMAYLNLPLPAKGTGVGYFRQQRPVNLTLRDLTYYLEDTERGRARISKVSASARLPGRTLTSRNADEWDTEGPASGIAVDVHTHLATIWDYYAQNHGYYGWNGQGQGMIAVVHYGDRQPIALYTGRHLVFGDGDGQEFLPLGASLDVVSHEYAHAILSELVGSPSSVAGAAIHEGLADLSACLIERSTNAGNWTIGEQIHIRSGQPDPLRDLESPHRTNQAQSASELSFPLDGLLLPEKETLSHVSHAAGVVGHAGYLLAGQIGDEATATLLFRAISLYLHPFSGLTETAEAMTLAAQDLHGVSSPQARAVRSAWSKVGVIGLFGDGDG